MTPKEKQKYHQMSVGGELKLSPDFQKNGGNLVALLGRVGGF